MKRIKRHHTKLTCLEKIAALFKQYGGTITAFSGGVDSALVLYLSRKYLGKNNTIGVISASESLKEQDYLIASKFCETHDIKLITIKTNELKDKNYSANPANRCYICKSYLYKALEEVKKQYLDFEVLNGTNADDLGDFRPGIEAGKENNIKSPLVELGIGKKEIRKMAKDFGLEVWNKPASPCLSSRIPYGNKVTAAKLIQIEEAEKILNNYGFYEVRARHYGNNCKIEVPLKRLDELTAKFLEIETELLALGFATCSIDESGFESGKLNKALALKHA